MPKATISGPKLGYPPPVAVEKLIEAAEEDPASAAWFDSLDRYYTKLEETGQMGAQP